MHPENVARRGALECGAGSALKHEAGSLRLPVCEKDQHIVAHAARPEIVLIVVYKAAFSTLQITRVIQKALGFHLAQASPRQHKVPRYCRGSPRSKSCMNRRAAAAGEFPQRAPRSSLSAAAPAHGAEQVS